MDEDQIITVTCLYPPPYPAPYRASSASSASFKTGIQYKHFLEGKWRRFRLSEFQNRMPPNIAIYCGSIEGIFIVPNADGTTSILYKEISVARDGIHPFPCMHPDHYNYMLPTILKIFGQLWWSCNSHPDLYHFKTSASYNAILYAPIDEPNNWQNTEIQYDNMVSPCQQLVMSTLLCSQEFSVRLPLRLILNILTFLPQVLFRGGDVVNCCPIENDVDDIHNFNNLNNL